jgi:hypothetical protein
MKTPNITHERSPKTLSLSRPVPAVEILNPQGEGNRFGGVTQLALGTQVELLGAAFNSKTTRIRTNGRCYFVFAQDIQG